MNSIAATETISAFTPFGLNGNPFGACEHDATFFPSEQHLRALEYMGLEAGTPIQEIALDRVFIGSCTNSRISDLRQAAGLLRGRKVDPGVRVLVVPGSQDVKRQAEAEGLAEVFRAAGAEWREAGCSMCLAMNGDQLAPGQYAVSTSNRNFEGRQGAGGRTFLASPLTAAASALAWSAVTVTKASSSSSVVFMAVLC